MTDITPQQTGEREALASFFRVLAADVAAGAPRPYEISVPTVGTAKMQVWPDRDDREVAVALWGRVLGADSIRVEHGWGSNGSTHYSATGEYGDGWTLEVWTTTGGRDRDDTVGYVPTGVYLDRLESQVDARLERLELDQPTSTPAQWLGADAELACRAARAGTPHGPHTWYGNIDPADESEHHRCNGVERAFDDPPPIN